MNRIMRIKRKLHRAGSLILCLIMLLALVPGTASADNADEGVIRAAFFEGSYTTVNEKGERSGYGYEYLRNIAGYAGWSMEYVPSSWETCFAQLENGEIDILGGISYTDERAEKMLFSDSPMGQERYYIYTDASNTRFSAADIGSFAGASIGVLADHIPEDVLNAWETKYGLHLRHVNVSSVKDTMEKLARREIDCFVSVEDSVWESHNVSPITNIGESDIYFVISKNRPDIKEALDSAMRRIKDDDPFYTDELYRRYLSTLSRAFLSAEEKEWLAQHGNIRIGYLNNDLGVSAIDPDTGELVGVIRDYMSLARDCLQGQTLEFEVRGYDTRAQQLQALNDGEIDLIFHVSQNPYSAETNGFVLSDTVWVFSMAATTARESFDENAENTVAVAKDNFSLKAYISYNYPQWTIKEYDTKKAADKAMQNGEVDCVLSNSGAVSDYLKNKKLHSIFLTRAANTSFAIRRGEPVLLSVMNKTLMSMPTTKLSGAVVSYSHAMRKVTLTDFIQDNLLHVSAVFMAVFLLVLAVVFSSLQSSRRAEEKARQVAAQATELNKQLEKKQQELQTALSAAESANKAKTIFLNNMSHDIRTPINGIIGMLAILEKSGADPERTKDCLHKIDMSSQLLLSLVNDVLDMAKLESDAVIMNNEVINLNQVCDEVTGTVLFQAENAGITVTMECDDYRGVYVRSSALHLKKILLNLFSNSIKYNKTNGSIHTSMKTLSQTENSITVEFKISDTGIGMSEDFVKNRLFTPFVQAEDSSRTSYMGTGLGMPIVKGIVEKMGGTISVESKLGEGSCFTVVMPFELAECELPAESEETPASDISGLKLLLVEDNELNAEIACFMLTDNGAEVETVENGLEALRKFKAAQPGAYDAILMDVMMPVMDGLTAAREIRTLPRQDAKTIPIIAMTANAFAEDAQRCLEAGMTAHIAKPVDGEKAVAVIAQCCRGRNP